MAVMNVAAYSGQIIYNSTPSAQFPSYETGGTGGVSGKGQVWSDSSQIMWIQLDSGVKYPVYLEPGWNDIEFWIPNIYPEDIWLEAPLIIEVPGYILIPAGFEWDVLTDESAPEKLGNKKMTDSLKFIDTYDIEIVSQPKPIDLDKIIEELEFNDFIDSDIINASISETSCIDEYTYDDIHNIELELPPFSGDADIIDDLIIEDNIETELINTTITDNPNIDNTDFTDIIDTELINTTITDSPNIDDIRL